MFAKMTQALLLTDCLIGAGTASANDRNVIVPVIAGAAVGAVLATVIAKSGDDDRRHHRAPPRADYRPRYQPVAYVPVSRRVEYRRVAAPPSRFYRHDYRHDGRHYQSHRRDDHRW